MRKIISVLVLASLLVLPMIASAAVAIPPEVTQCTMRNNLTGADWTGYGFYCPASGTACPFAGTGCTVGGVTCTCGSCCLFDTIYTISNWLFIIVTAVSFIFIIIGAFTIITAGGAPESATKGRNYILYAVIGLIVALAAKAIPALVRAILAV